MSKKISKAETKEATAVETEVEYPPFRQEHGNTFDQLTIKVEEECGTVKINVYEGQNYVQQLSIDEWRELAARVEASIKYVTKEQA